jgi:hypothetical protein
MSSQIENYDQTAERRQKTLTKRTLLLVGANKLLEVESVALRAVGARHFFVEMESGI